MKRLEDKVVIVIVTGAGRVSGRPQAAQGALEQIARAQGGSIRRRLLQTPGMGEITISVHRAAESAHVVGIVGLVRDKPDFERPERGGGGKCYSHPAQPH